METIVQYGLSTLVENATVVNIHKNRNTLQGFTTNVLTVKNTYKTGYRIGVSLVHLQKGGSVYYPPFMCNVASLSCSFAAMGCRAASNLRPMGGLSLLADGLSICGDVMAKGGQERPKISQMIM